MSTYDERVVRRATRITRERPGAPRNVVFDISSNLLTWKGPQNERTVTHYRVRVASDSAAPTYQPPVGQNALQVTPGITQVYISSYNQVNNLESPLVQAGLAPTVLGGATPPDRGTLTFVQQDYTPTDKLTGAIRTTIILNYAAPGGVNPGKGVAFWFEIPDQSSGSAPAFVLGTSGLGTTAVVVGEQGVQAMGEMVYATNGRYTFTFDMPEGDSETWRAYADTYGNNYHPTLVRANRASPTPSVTFTVRRKKTTGTDAVNQGHEACDNVTGLTNISSYDQNDSGKMHSYINLGWTWPQDKKCMSAVVDVVKADGSLLRSWSFKVGQVDPTGGALIYIDTPSPIVTYKIRVRASDGNNVNAYVPNTTPEILWTPGTAGGLDFRNALTSTIAAHLGQTSGVFGVLPAAITTDLVANFGIATNNLADGAVVGPKITDGSVTGPKIPGNAIVTSHILDGNVTGPKIPSAAIGNAHINRLGVDKLAVADADIVNLAAAKILAGSLSSGVIYTNYIAANQISAGDITTCSLTQNDGTNYVTIRNANDATVGINYGVKVGNSALTDYAIIAKTGLYLVTAGDVHYAAGITAKFEPRRITMANLNCPTVPQIFIDTDIYPAGSVLPAITVSWLWGITGHSIKIGSDASGNPGIWVDSVKMNVP